MVTPAKPNRVRSERLRRGWTQTELTERTGIRQPHLSTYENGEVFPDPNNIQRLAQAFGVPADVVYRWILEPATEEAACA